MDKGTFINIGLGILQVIVLLFQVWVASKEYNRNKKIKKGIFTICYNNFIAEPYKSSIRNWEYQLDKYVSFKNIGDDFVRLIKTDVIVNGMKKYDNHVPSGITFSPSGEFSTYLVNFQLNEMDLKKDELNIDLVLHLENSVNYKYEQKISMMFYRDEEYQLWRLKKYNWNFKR